MKKILFCLACAFSLVNSLAMAVPQEDPRTTIKQQDTSITIPHSMKQEDPREA